MPPVGERRARRARLAAESFTGLSRVGAASSQLPEHGSAALTLGPARPGVGLDSTAIAVVLLAGPEARVAVSKLLQFLSTIALLLRRGVAGVATRPGCPRGVALRSLASLRTNFSSSVPDVQKANSRGGADYKVCIDEPRLCLLGFRLRVSLQTAATGVCAEQAGSLVRQGRRGGDTFTLWRAWRGPGRGPGVLTAAAPRPAAGRRLACN